MFAVYICGYDGSYNPFDGGMFGPFDTVEDAKKYCEDDSDRTAIENGETCVKLNWIQDTFSKRVNLGAEGSYETCYLVQELTKDNNVDYSNDDELEDEDDIKPVEIHGVGSMHEILIEELAIKKGITIEESRQIVEEYLGKF